MKIIQYILPSAALVALAACGDISMTPTTHTKKVEEVEVNIVKMTDVLFCFKCHSAARYSGEEGGFPHIKHKAEFGINLHCNQCHEFAGHRKMKVVSKSVSPCSGCH